MVDSPGKSTCLPRSPADNPFATDGIDSLPAVLIHAEWSQLWERLDRLGGRACIIGPEGSGKSTILRAMACQAAHRGYRVWQGRCRCGRLRPAWGNGTFTANDALFLDSVEQLSPRMWRLCQKWASCAGLAVVTCHQPCAWPVLYRTETSPDLLARLFELLAEPVDARLHAINCRLWHKYSGNLRLVFREWYERWSEGHPAARFLQRKTAR
ncbi:MAG: hypothetical protein KatS3mg110_3418 [Pirellulaceae bacterium]|nr:MAG: hypothetical protein KatS3mg110_3418 [Pirellulaceae bacterium]